MAYEYWFWTPLTCLDCHREVPAQQVALEANGLNPQLHGRWVEPGEVMPVEVDDFGIAFAPLRPPAPGEPLRVLIAWVCPDGVHEQWARATFTVLPGGVRFDTAETVAVTPDELAHAHFADSGLPPR